MVGALETVFNCSMVVFVGVDGREERFDVNVVVLAKGDVRETAVPDMLPPAAAFIIEAMAKIGFWAGDDGGGITVCECCCCCC